jgi:hypothetical protein
MLDLDLDARNVGDNFLLHLEYVCWNECTSSQGLCACEGLKQRCSFAVGTSQLRLRNFVHNHAIRVLNIGRPK